MLINLWYVAEWSEKVEKEEKIGEDAKEIQETLKEKYDSIKEQLSELNKMEEELYELFLWEDGTFEFLNRLPISRMAEDIVIEDVDQDGLGPLFTFGPDNTVYLGAYRGFLRFWSDDELGD